MEANSQEEKDQDDEESDDLDDLFANKDVRTMNVDTCGKSLRRRCSKLFFLLQVRMGFKEMKLTKKMNESVDDFKIRLFLNE